jgi:predicted acyltransferase
LHTKARGQVYWSLSLLLLYWMLVKLVPVPGYGTGVLEPTGNLLWYVDSSILNGHTWAYAPAPGFDPEGILSTVPAIATTLFGVLAGQWLRSEKLREEKTAWMFVVGTFLLLVGVILDMWLPINKNMWTSSYVVFMGGWSLVSLAAMYWLVDVKGYAKWGKPFTILGMNAILIYVLSELLWTSLWSIQWQGTDGAMISLQEFTYTSFFAPLASPLNASLLFAIAYVLTMFVVAWMFWKKHWFLKV